MSDTFSDVEKRQLSQLRQQSITASFIDAMSAKNVIKDSCDDFFGKD